MLHHSYKDHIGNCKICPAISCGPVYIVNELFSVSPASSLETTPVFAHLLLFIFLFLFLDRLAASCLHSWLLSVKSGNVAASLTFVLWTQPRPQGILVNAPGMESERECDLPNGGQKEKKCNREITFSGQEIPRVSPRRNKHVDVTNISPQAPLINSIHPSLLF